MYYAKQDLVAFNYSFKAFNLGMHSHMSQFSSQEILFSYFLIAVYRFFKSFTA